jgi:xylulose-5-phosphate/fructose-6-phosphate phosphoketolase
MTQATVLKSDAFLFFGGRCSLAIDVIDRLPRLKVSGAHVKRWLPDQILEHLAYANEHGVDTPEIQDWKRP